MLGLLCVVVTPFLFLWKLGQIPIRVMLCRRLEFGGPAVEICFLEVSSQAVWYMAKFVSVVNHLASLKHSFAFAKLKHVTKLPHFVVWGRRYRVSKMCLCTHAPVQKGCCIISHTELEKFSGK
jgi:hypothetical protein